MDFNINDWTAKEDDPRTHIHEPFEYDGRRVATSGAALISTELKGLKLPNVEESVANALEKLIKDLQNTQLSKVDLHQCEMGEFGLELDCKECDGLSRVFFENEHSSYDMECKSCNGEGSYIKPSKYVEIDGLHFTLENVERLYHLNNLKVASMGDKIGFEADEGFGFVMAIRKEREVE